MGKSHQKVSLFRLMGHNTQCYVNQLHFQQASCHNRCNSVRSIILCILTTACGIVVLYQIFKYICKEIIVLLKCFFKEKFTNLSTKARAKVLLYRPLHTVSAFQKRYFCILSSLSWKYINILICYICHRYCRKSNQIAFACWFHKLAMRCSGLSNGISDGKLSKISNRSSSSTFLHKQVPFSAFLRTGLTFYFISEIYH